MSKTVVKKKSAVRARELAIAKLTESRENYIQKILAVNPPSVLATVDKMVEQLYRMHPQVVRSEVVTTEYRWVAVRCLVALAEWGIKIGDFKLPKKSCARCGKRVKSG